MFNMKAILFDACDILYHRPRFEQDLDRFLGADRRQLSRDGVQSLKGLQACAAIGKLSVEEMFDGMLDLYGLPPERLGKGRRFLNNAMADVEFFDGVCPALHLLKADDFKLAVVTNSFQRSATKLSWMAKVGIDGVWDAFVSSSETGLLKPAPEIYLTALDRLKCGPRQAAFVAHAANELDGAKAVGMTTIAFNRDDPSVQADYIIEHFGDLVALAHRLRQTPGFVQGQ
ncbi:MAG: HAD family hydrolase [Alphaproteobacteria bacterium]